MDIILATVSCWTVGGIVLCSTDGVGSWTAFPLALLTFAVVLALTKTRGKR